MRHKMERALAFGEGVLNLGIHLGQAAELELHFNFHRDSESHEQLVSWLEIPMGGLRGKVDGILKALSVGPEETGDDQFCRPTG